MAMRRTLVLLLGLALLGMRATPIHAQEEVVLQLAAGDPQARAINTWLDETTVANQSTPHNTDADLQVQTSNVVGQNQHAILLFDISRIPRSGIKVAMLNLWLDAAPTPAGESWDVDQITSLIATPQASHVTWLNRTNQLTWGAPGGDFSGPPVCQSFNGTTPACQITTAPGAVSSDVTSTFMTYFGNTVPAPNPNYGFLIKDTTENNAALAAAATGTIASNSNGTPAHFPSLVVDFVQQVHSLTATPSATNVVLNWTYPTAVGTTTGLGLNGFGLNPTTGVVILRRAGGPVEDIASFSDGTAPTALCNLVNGSAATIVVFNGGTGLPTTFTDDSTDTCGFALDTTYFYKVIAVASLGGGNYNYSEEGNAVIFTANGFEDTSFVAEISATPSGTVTPQGPVWIGPVRAAALNAPSIDPGNYAIIGTDNFLLQGFDPKTGDDKIAPVSIGGIIGGSAGSRMPVLESTEADPHSGFGSIPMTYLAADDNLVYDVGLLSPPGILLDFLNPLGGVPIPGAYVGGVAMQAKAFSNSGNTKPDDVLIMGTDVAGGPPTENTIFAAVTCSLSVAPGTGCSGAGGGWNISGGSITSTGCSATSTAATCNIDIITSTPFVDYQNNTVWVTTHNNNTTTAGTFGSPDILKLDANSGAVLAAVCCLGDIDSSPTGTQDQSVIFVGTNNGVLLAYDPTATDNTGPFATPHQLASVTITPADGAVKGFPLVVSSGPPWLVVVTTTNDVQLLSLSFNSVTMTWSFSTLWTNTTLGCNPSSPVAAPNLKDASNNPVAIVGCSDGTLREINLNTSTLAGGGTDEADRIVDQDPILGNALVGDPSLDISTNYVIVGASDGRVFAFKAPF